MMHLPQQIGRFVTGFVCGDRPNQPPVDAGRVLDGTGSTLRMFPRLQSAAGQNRCQFGYQAGLPIARPLSPSAAVPGFLDWMRSQGFCGEYLWRDLLEYFAWFVTEERLVPFPEQQRAMFAHELSKHCKRGQVRLTENGRRRRLTTYFLEPASAELVVA
jgi:hypothetical protein